MKTSTRSTRIASRRRDLLLGLSLGLCGLIVAGCHVIHQSSNTSMPSVYIDGNTPGQIRDVAVDVFGRDGYQATKTGLTNLVFEKQASAAVNIAYGGWMEGPVWIRVRASIIPAGDRAFRLEGEAFRVSDKGSPIEQETRFYAFENRDLQKLLDEVGKRLGGNGGSKN